MDTPALGHFLKIWADGAPCKGEVKGAMVNLQHHKFVVTSNFSIETLFKDQPAFIEPILRRFKVIEYTKKYTGAEGDSQLSFGV